MLNGQSYSSTVFERLFQDFQAGLVIAVQRTGGDQLLNHLQESALFQAVPIKVSGELFTCLIYSRQSPGHLKANVLQAIRAAMTSEQHSPVIVGMGHPVSNPLQLQKSAAEAKLSYYQRKKMTVRFVMAFTIQIDNLTY